MLGRVDLRNMLVEKHKNKIFKNKENLDDNIIPLTEEAYKEIKQLLKNRKYHVKY